MRALLCALLLAGCTVDLEDSTLYLTGTEEGALTGPNGKKSCMNQKVLICHIPPGNPANAHTICVGAPAVDPHVGNHHDLVGACAKEPTPPPAEPPPPTLF